MITNIISQTAFSFNYFVQHSLIGDEKAAHRAVTGFIRAMVAAVPSGMQSGSAAYNEPALLMGVVRSDGKQWNLSNAFEQPVHTSNGSGLIQPSIQALDEQWQTVSTFYDDAQIEALSVYIQPKYHAALSEQSPFPAHLQTTASAWVDSILDALPQE